RVHGARRAGGHRLEELPIDERELGGRARADAGDADELAAVEERDPTQRGEAAPGQREARELVAGEDEGGAQSGDTPREALADPLGEIGREHLREAGAGAQPEGPVVAEQ